jgi:Tfp pilus assembly protein PilE
MRKAFSMIELIFIVIIIGILASAVQMSMPDPKLYSDSDYIIQKISQTRMQALLYDHAVLGDEQWREGDYNDTCIKLNKDYLNNLDKKTNNPKKYSISSRTTLSASVEKVCFDYLGRPYKNDYKLNNFLKMPIELNITYKQKRKQVLIMPFSGGVIVRR